MGWRAGLVGFLAVVVGAGVSLVRQPGPGALDTMWDEDGRIFLADAANRSVLKAFSTAYEGYYHVVPRLLAEIAVLFPASRAAAAMAILSAATISALGLFVYLASRAHLPQWPLRLLVSVPVVVLPMGQNELPNAVCNLHWPMLYAAFWALLWIPARRAAAVVTVVLVALTVTSDLATVAFLPVAVALLYFRRDRRSVAVFTVLLIGFCLQFAGLLIRHNPRDLGPPRPDPVWALASFMLRPVPLILIGQRALPDDLTSPEYLALVSAAWLLVLGALVVAIRGWTHPDWVLAAVLFAQAAALYCTSVMAGGIAVPRYAAAPGLMVLAGIASLVRPPSNAAIWRRGVVPALLVLVGVVCAINLRVDNPRAQGPSWRNSIRYARAACNDQPIDATVPVAVSPRVNAVTAELPCGYIRH
jgi:hypothetical protein